MKYNLLKSPASRIDLLFKSLFILSVFLLGTVAGAASMYYRGPLFGLFTQAFEGANAHKAGTAHSKKKPRPASIEPFIKRYAVTHWDKEAAYNGYTLISLKFEDVYLIDMDGNIVRQWHLPAKAAWPNPQHVPDWDLNIQIERVRLLPDGSIIVLYDRPHGTPYGYGLAKYDRDSKLLWTYDDMVHHDFHINDDGSIYVLAQKFVTQPWPELRHIYYPQLADYIVTLTPDGKEIARVSIVDAFLNSDHAKTLKARARRASMIGRWDHTHANSLDVLHSAQASAFPMFKSGQVLVSMRNIHALAVIDMEKKAVVWARRGRWLTQHAAHFLDEGRMALFDNRGLKRYGRRFSRILALDPENGRLAWEFSGGKEDILDSRVNGRVEPLQNGNMLIVESDGNTLWEVTRDKQVVWKYTYSGRSQWANILSAIRYHPQELPFLFEK